jgi:hypothetical protein
MTLHPGPSTLGRSVPWAAQYSGPPSTLGRPVPWAAQYPGPPTDPVDRAGVAVAGRVGQRRARAFIPVVPGRRPGTRRVVALGVVVASHLVGGQRPAQDAHLVDAPVKVPGGTAGIPADPHRIGGLAPTARHCRTVDFHPALVQPHPAAVVQQTHKHEERESLERPSRSCNSRGSACRRDGTTPSLHFTEQRTAFQCDQWVQCVSDYTGPALFAGGGVGFYSVRRLTWLLPTVADSPTVR